MTHTSPLPKASQAILGAGLPPVPSKLVRRIECGEFIELSELLPEKLSFDVAEEDSGKGKSKKKLITSILEWVQCFSLYTAIISQKQPERVPDLLGYQSLIIDAHREFKGDYWMGYDRRFRLRAAAASQVDKWANVDITLWSLAFASRGSSARCKFCFSTSHDSSTCDLSSDTQSSSAPYRTPPLARLHFTKTHLL